MSSNGFSDCITYYCDMIAEKGKDNNREKKMVHKKNQLTMLLLILSVRKVLPYMCL